MSRADPFDTTGALPFGLRLLTPPPQPRPGEILGLVVARNEALRLGAALRHARALGVGPILVIDNLSEDGTREVARAQEGVHLIEAPGSFAAANFGIDWTNAVLDRFAPGHWVLVIDADELLVFPGSEIPGALPALCAHLDRLGSEALLAFMLDMFPQEPLHATRYRPGEDLLAAAPWFEPPRLRRERGANFPHAEDYGGIRERLFFPETDPRRPARFLRQKLYNLGWRVPALRRQDWYRRLAPRRSPNLAKVPLVRWREGARYLTNHSLTPMAMAEGQPSGVLLHFKFLQDFHERVMDAVSRGAHFDGSVEYRRYLAALKRDPDFTLHGPRSLRYQGPQQLIGLGLMRDTPDWQAARGTAGPAPLPDAQAMPNPA